MMNEAITFFKGNVKKRALEILERIPICLKTVLKDHGFNKEKSKWLFVLLLIYQEIGKPISFNGVENFSTLQQANNWLVNMTQSFIIKGERWEQQEIASSLQIYKKLLLEAATCLGMREAIRPSMKENDWALIPGATAPAVKHRIEAFLSSLSEGYKPVGVLALSGQRNLQEEEYKDVELLERTEDEMMRDLIHAYCLQYPIEFIYATKQPQNTRAQTTDNALSLQAWLLMQDKSIESYHFILYIEQPFAQRFLSIFTNTLGEKASVEVFSQKWDGSRVFLITDELGKRIGFQSDCKLSRQYSQEKQPVVESSPSGAQYT